MVKRYLSQHLALICLAGSEKTGFTDDGRATDDERQRDDSICSSAVQYHRAELKILLMIKTLLTLARNCNALPIFIRHF